VRPVFVEVPLAVLANIKLEDEEGER